MPGRFFPILLVNVLLFAPFSSSAWSHGGGIDTFGCHNDRKHGGYHCHHGPFAGQTFNSKSEMVGLLKETKGRKDTAPK